MGNAPGFRWDSQTNKPDKDGKAREMLDLGFWKGLDQMGWV